MQKRLLILGSAKCLWDDLEMVDTSGYDIMAINYTALLYPGDIDHMVSIHYRFLKLIKEVRNVSGLNTNFLTHSIKDADGVDYIWGEYRSLSGSSGLLATLVGKELGYEKIVLAGIPMDDTCHFYDRFSINFQHKNFMMDWNRCKKKGLLDGVVSLSGNTKLLLGN